MYIHNLENKINTIDKRNMTKRISINKQKNGDFRKIDDQFQERPEPPLLLKRA